MSYLTMVMGFMASKPLGPDFDFIWVHYADWVICTPLLLVDLSVLAGCVRCAHCPRSVRPRLTHSPSPPAPCSMKAPEVFMLMCFDVLMIGSGYGSEIALTPEGIWPLYAFSCVCECSSWSCC